ncbi:MAG: DegT/DnrJ/EryC1/StrS family aminotransferase [Phycisphaerae bacterium]|jgi:dTDP-4-amino-4,6-dideoxygalactose transaminase|nr:DegT/DnrJ/EryC1/StrS family aminotransferase [Phycisphaerae bacterium]
MAKLAIEGGRKTVTRHPAPWPRLGPDETKAAMAAVKAASKDPSMLSCPDGRGIVAKFEERFARKMGTKYAMTTCGGGPALHIALMAAGVQAGDEVICPTYSWGQSVSCVLQANAIPIFADIDPDTYTMTAKTIEAKLTRYTRAIVVVHIFGHPVDMGPIMRLARRRGIPVIEDAAQATGAKYKGKRVGSLGDIGCFSIGDGKQIIGGEGGLLLTSDRGLYERGLLTGHHPVRHWQITDPELKAWSDSLIYTYRMYPMAAVICNVMLDKMDRLNAERRRNYRLLSKGLADIPGIKVPVVKKNCEHVFHIYSPTFVPEEVEGVKREVWVEALGAEGMPIGMGYVWRPIHLRRRLVRHAYFSGRGVPWTLHRGKKDIRYRKGDCPVAEARCANTELSIWGGPAWIGDQSKIVEQFLRAFRKVTDNLDVLRKRSKQKRK